MKKLMFVLLLFTLAMGNAWAAELSMGILAKRGKTVFYETWSLHGMHLSESTGDTWKMVPLAFDEIEPAVRNGSLDFLLTNSSMFVDLKQKYGLEAIATLRKATRLGETANQFGGVIFTHRNSPGIDSLYAVKGQPFFAVQESSLGGYQMAAKELLDLGIDIRTETASLTFLNTHDQVVQRVLAEPGSVGTVRTDTLEGMSFEGRADIEKVKVLGVKQHAGFPFAVSTALYPEWPMAKLAHVDEATGQRVKTALINMAPDNYAAKSANIAGWSEPLDYAPVRRVRAALSDQ